MALAPNECTICKHECCKFETFWQVDPIIIAIPEQGAWWCDACDCHKPYPEDWDAWDTIDV